MARVVVFALLAIVCVQSAEASCPAGSITGLDGAACYKVHAAALSWLEAEGHCKAENGHLATVATCITNNFLAKTTADISNATDYWLGGVWNAEKALAWSWEDGSTWKYTNWASGQPINDSVCLAFNARTSKWSTEDCSKAMPYLCQVSAIGRKGLGLPSPPPNLPAPSAPLRCPYGWQYLEYTNLCYTILEHVHNAYSWNQAKTLCLNAGGGLLSIPNKKVGDAIVTYALEAAVNGDKEDVILGASYENSTSEWHWSDGSEMRYTNWADGYPDSIESLMWCAYLRIRAPEIGAWSNYLCNEESAAVICERESFAISDGSALPPPNLRTPPPPVRCPEGWLYLEASNLCYAVMEPRQNQYAWSEARNACTEAGGDLVSIPNRAVNDALILLATDAELVPDEKNHKGWYYLAIGASHNNVTSEWEWTDGSDMCYTNWHNVDAYTPVDDGCAYMRLLPYGVGTWFKTECLLGEGEWAILCERSSFDI